MPTESLRSRRLLPAMTEMLAELVSVESSSQDVSAVARCAATIEQLGSSLLGVVPERILIEDRPHLKWQFGATTEILLLAHLDTVWPTGTIDTWPFHLDDGVATGPGVFDDKAGVVQGLFAMAELTDRDGMTLLVTSDEETGSPTSRRLIEDTARGARAALILESSGPAGALKIGRKGVSLYEVAIHGREAHAGLEPERGVNALTELAHQVMAVERLSDPEAGTTVIPTVASAGTVTNVIPAAALMHVDVRAWTSEEQLRVDALMKSLAPAHRAARLEVRGAINRPALPVSAAIDLFDRAQRVAKQLGLDELEGVSVGGSSDGNFTAAIGTPTLDGLGGVGGGAHAKDEHVLVGAMPDRVALITALIEDLRSDVSS